MCNSKFYLFLDINFIREISFIFPREFVARQKST